MTQPMKGTTMRSVLLLAGGVLAAGSLAACGASPSANTAGAAPGSGTAQQGYGAAAGTGSGAQAARFPGTSGTIAEISGSTLQVQNQTDGQVAVTYSGTTTFTAQVAATLSDVTVGSCVTVTPVTSSTNSGSAPAGAVTAGAVRISPPQNGSCARGLGFAAGGERPSGQGFGGPSGRPTNMPTDMPSGAPSGAARSGFLGGAGGTVAAVTATGFTLTEERPDFSSGGPSAGASPSMVTTTVAVTVNSATTYTTTQPATSAALKVGKCVTATGQADSTGAVSATRIAVSDPENGQCGGFGFFRSDGDGPGGAAPGGAAPGGAAPGGAS